jgi:DNA-binding IclR family transcriptional regulator
VAVLELLAAHPDDRFTLSEVARRCHLNKATAHALLSALSERGVLLRHPAEKRYSLGPVLVSIGEAARRGYSASDFVGPTLEELAGTTGLWARGWRLEDDHIAVVGEAGRPRGRPQGPPLRLPPVPPVGVLGMAYADPPTVEAWLARAPSAEGAGEAAAALPVIRRDGYVVMRATPEWRVLTGTASQGPAVVSDASSLRDALTGAARQPLVVTDLGDGARVAVGEVAAPVFAWDGAMALALSVATCSDEPMSAERIRQLAGAVVEAAGRLTALVGGEGSVHHAT